MERVRCLLSELTGSSRLQTDGRGWLEIAPVNHQQRLVGHF